MTEAEAAPDLQIERVPVESLQVFPGNPRRGDIAALAASLKRRGQYKPIVVSADGFILAGNHTYQAALSLGWLHILVVRSRLDSQSTEAREIVLADNRLADLGGYAQDELMKMLLDVPDLPDAAIGYTQTDLAALLRKLDPAPPPPALTDVDDLPAKIPKVAEVGQVWALGAHLLVVADSTDPANWDKVEAAVAAALAVPGHKFPDLEPVRPADAVWTDPPYGVSYVGKTADAMTIDNDTDDDGEQLLAFLTAAFTTAMARTRPGAVWYVTGPPGPAGLAFFESLSALGVLRQLLVWVKDAFVLGHSDYHYRHETVHYGSTPGADPQVNSEAAVSRSKDAYRLRHENVFYGWTPGAAHHKPPDRKRDSVFEFPRPRASRDHPTMKPVGLIREHLLTSTLEGDLVLDPFAGSGSTLIACHGTQRRALAFEADPSYADVILTRFIKHTGIRPTLVS